MAKRSKHYHKRIAETYGRPQKPPQPRRCADSNTEEQDKINNDAAFARMFAEKEVNEERFINDSHRGLEKFVLGNISKNGF
jgi:hypothetical protein